MIECIDAYRDCFGLMFLLVALIWSIMTSAAHTPGSLWVADITDVPTLSGFGSTALITMCLPARLSVLPPGRACAPMHCHWQTFEHASYHAGDLRAQDRVHHSDRGVQYVSIRDGEALAQAGIDPLVGTVGDSYNNA